MLAKSYMKEQKQQNPKGCTSTQMLLRESQNEWREGGITETMAPWASSCALRNLLGSCPATASQHFLPNKSQLERQTKVLQKPCLQQNLKTDNAKNFKITVSKKRKSFVSQQYKLLYSQSMPTSQQTAPAVLLMALRSGGLQCLVPTAPGVRSSV